MTKEITGRQMTVLEFIKEHIEAFGYPPTIREIAAHLKITSLKAVKRHLEALERKGFIKRGAGVSRAIEIIGARPARDVREVPIVGAVRAGRPDLAAEDILGSIVLDSAYARWDDAFFLKVKGDSMIDKHIKDGDLALVKPTREAKNGDIVVALIGDEATLKTFYREKGRVRLQPANPEIEPIIIYEDEPQFSIIGQIVGIFRLFQT